MADKKQVIADIEKINAVEVRYIDGVEMFEVSQLEKYFNKPVLKFMDERFAREYVKALAYVKHQQKSGGKITANYVADRLKILDNLAFTRTDGHWLCKELFIEYARWLSPYFAVKCNLCCAHLVPTLDKRE